MMADAENTGKIGRNPDGTFGPGNPGKPKGSRHKLGEEFLAAMQADFAGHGVTVIETVRTERPQDYLKIVASLLPKEHKIIGPMDEMTDDQLAERLGILEQIIGFARGDGGTVFASQGGEGPTRRPQ